MATGSAFIEWMPYASTGSGLEIMGDQAGSLFSRGLHPRGGTNRVSSRQGCSGRKVIAEVCKQWRHKAETWKSTQTKWDWDESLFSIEKEGPSRRTGRVGVEAAQRRVRSCGGKMKLGSSYPGKGPGHRGRFGLPFASNRQQREWVPC